MDYLRLVLISITLNGIFISPSCAMPNLLIQVQEISCFNASDGVIHITIPKSQIQCTATLFKYKPEGTELTHKTKHDSLVFIANNLSVGTYTLVLDGINDSTLTQKIVVRQPEPLKANKIEVVKRLTTPDAKDATLKVSAHGGNPPYTFNWSHDQNNIKNILTNVPQGIYSCTINDANQCGPVQTTIIFNQTVMPDIVQNHE